MRLTQKEFDKIEFMRKCVVEIPSLKANEVTTEGGLKLIVPDSVEFEREKDEYDRQLLAKMAKKLVSMPREDETKKALRKEYIAFKESVNKRTEENKDTNEGYLARQATRKGILVKKPLKNVLEEGNMFSCELDAEIGDEVYWDGFWTTQQIKHGLGDKTLDDSIIEVDDKLYLIIPSVALFAARRGDDWIPLNGYVIASPIREETEEISKAGIITKKEPSNVARARVVSVPKSKPKFRDEAFKVTEVKVGDVVITRPFYQLELDKTYASETKLVRILTGVIMATE